MDQTRSTRTRRSTKRTRTGCRTCRIRRVKCDETPGACRNCTSSGRTCEGYDMYRLPIARKSGGLPRPLSSRAVVMTSDDRRCYSYFQFHVAPEIASFTSVLWQKLVLQMTEAEPAVLHAVIGLSAISQSVSAACKAQKHAISLKYDPWRQFGLEQLGRSFALLSRRHSSHDPQLVQVTLMCCLIFIVCDLLQHQYNHAFNHLQNGIQILSELGYGRVLIPQVSVEQELVAAFQQLETQSTPFRGQQPVLWLPKEKSATHPSSKRSSPGLQLTFESLRSSVLKFTTDLVFLPEGQSATQYEAEYLTLLERGNQFIKEVDSHYARVYPHLSQEERKHADLMRIHTSGEGLVLKCCFPTGTLEPHAEHFRSHLSLIETFLHRFPERPGMTMDEAVLPSLVLVAFGSPDLDVRWRAIDVLLAWPHLEGPWDSRAIARKAIENTPEYVPGCVEIETVRVRKPISQKRFTMILQEFFHEIGDVKS